MKKFKILLAIALGSTVMLVTVGNGCSKRDAFNSISQSSSSGSNSSSSTQEEVIDPTVKMVSLTYAKQMLDQVTSCVGLKSPTDDTIRVYQQKSGAISLYGDAGSVTAPMMMATTSIVAEVCDDLIEQEIADIKSGKGAHIFLNWSLDSAADSQTLPANGDITDAISRIALSCWQKAPSNVETTAFLDLAITGAPTRKNSALMVCTGMLSSLKTLLN